MLSYFYCCSLIFLELHSCGFHCGIILRSIAIGIYIYICRSLFCHSCILCHCMVMNILSVLHRSMILSCYSTQSYIHYTVSHVANSKQSLPPSRWTDYDASKSTHSSSAEVSQIATRRRATMATSILSHSSWQQQHAPGLHHSHSFTGGISI